MLLIILVALSVATYTRNITWRNDFFLYKDTVEKSPNKARPHLDLGRAYHRKRDLEQALREYTIAVALNPVYSEGYNNLATVYANLGLFDRAIALYTRALSDNPGNYASYGNLGQVFYKKKLFEEAIENFSKVLLIRPDHVEAYLNRGLAFARLGEVNHASQDFNNACRMGNAKGCDARDAYSVGDPISRDKLLNALERVQMDVNYENL